MPHVLGLKQKDMHQSHVSAFSEPCSCTSSVETKGEQDRRSCKQSADQLSNMRSMPPAHLWGKTAGEAMKEWWMMWAKQMNNFKHDFMSQGGKKKLKEDEWFPTKIHLIFLLNNWTGLSYPRQMDEWRNVVQKKREYPWRRAQRKRKICKQNEKEWSMGQERRHC